MISVPNHRQQLNGNKLLAGCLIFLALCFAACGSKKKVTDSKTVYLEADKKSEDTSKMVYPPMDTVQWTEIDLSDRYDDVLDELAMNKKDRYKIALLFPFELSNNKLSDVNQPESKLGRMTQYYAGVLMALDVLEKEGLSFDVEVMDAESGRFDSKLQSCKDADVIIGPRDTDQLAVVANFGKVNGIVVVSPWKSGARISQDNPYFLQLKTGLREHYAKMLEDALSRYSPDNIFILGRKTAMDKNYVALLQSMSAAILDVNTMKPLREFYVNEDSLINGEAAFDSIFVENDTSCFILPHWSFSSDEDFVYNVARKLSGEKGMADVVLYGMPILYESERIKFELYRSLNMRIVRSNFVDRNSQRVRAFREAYFERYRDFPIDEAFEAYDMMMFVGRSLDAYGTAFNQFLDRDDMDLIQTRYDVRKVYAEPESDDFEDIDYYQNQHLYILRFVDDRFKAY